MRRPPRPPAAPVLDGTLIARIVLVGVLMLAGAFGLFELALARGDSLAEARTVAVNVFVMVEAFYLFNCRSLTRPFWQLGWFSNPWIWAGAGAMMAPADRLHLPAASSIACSAPPPSARPLAGHRRLRPGGESDRGAGEVAALPNRALRAADRR